MVLVIKKDDFKTWMTLKNMKKSYHFEKTEFSKVRVIDDEPVFYGGFLTFYRKEMISWAIPALNHKEHHTQILC